MEIARRLGESYGRQSLSPDPQQKIEFDLLPDMNSIKISPACPALSVTPSSLHRLSFRHGGT